MSYEEFLRKINKPGTIKVNAAGDIYNHELDYWQERKFELKPSFIQVKWETGGVDGGNCWEDSSPQTYYSSNKEKSLSELDYILTIIDPNITFLQYKKLYEKVVETDEYTHHEYYGNCTYYAIKRVVLRKLYDELVSLGIIK